MPDGEGNIEVGTSPGEASKLIERSKKNPEQHLVLFSEVANKVLTVNPAIHVPFNLKEGEQSNLGMFAKEAFSHLNPEEKKKSPPKGEKFGEYWEGHDRSTIIARVLFRDEEGRLYRDVDLKGAGWLLVYPGDRKSHTVSVLHPGEYKPRPGKMMGLVGLDEAMADYENSEDFLKAGIRTSRVIAIIELKEIISGNKLSVEVLKEEGTIEEGFTPVIEVRAFATKTRFSDLTDYDRETTEMSIADAKKFIAQELGRKEPLTDQEYIDWLTDTLGRSVGLIHKNGWIHGGLRGQNITLDGKIVDLDTVETSSNSKKRVQDINLIINELARVRDGLLKIDFGDWDSFNKRLEKVREGFMESYYRAFPRGKKTKIEELLKAA